MTTRPARHATPSRLAALACVAVLAVACSAADGSAPAAQRATSTSPVTGSVASARPAAEAITPAATRPAARPAPADPCRANTAGQLVRVSVRQQHLWMCQGHTLVRDTPVTTGIPGENTHTPTGTYTVQARTRNTTLTLITGKTYAVKYWIPFDAPLFGFHDSSWQTIAYGSQRYRTDGSHGCVHVPVRAIAFLYRWVHVGATVRIRA